MQTTIKAARGLGLLATTVLALGGPAAMAQAPAAKPAAAPAAGGGICGALSREISNGEMRAADLDAEDIGDDSAPRATMRAGRKSAEMAQIGVNIDLMREHRCAPYPHVINPRDYLLPALQCNTALLKASNARVLGGADAKPDTTLPPECVRANWKRSGE